MASGQIRDPACGLQVLGHVPQSDVAHFVAMAVIDGFEVVDVDHRQRKPALLMVPMRKPLFPRCGQRAAVGQAG
ncbi:hypothetical protein D3C86_1923260 [compost metagenome]